jgi:serine/threonine-protein kinase
VLAGRFRVIRVIGKTAVGVLYEVEQQETHRRLTLEKLGLPLNPLKDDPGAFERFRHDADVVAKLHHPNIAEIVEWQTLEDGSTCLAMERPEGEDLAARMKQGVLPWSMVSTVTEQVLTALEAAHQAGVIHGALTPQHIFLAREPGGRERCKLHGFGVSRIFHLYPHPSFAEERIEAFYLSPEHAQGKTGELGPASDCFSFASILFELVTGKPPFSAASAGGIVYKIGHGRADSVLSHRPDAPPALDKVLARAWERDRESRLTAPALREELLAVLSSAQFLAGGSSAEIRVQPEAAAVPSTLLLPEPLPDVAPNEERAQQSILPTQWSLAALRQHRWFLPAVGGGAVLLLLLIVLMARKGSPPPLPAPAPAAAAPPAPEPAVAPPPAPAVAPPAPEPVDDEAPKKHHTHHHHSSSSKTSSTTHKSKDAPKPTSKKTQHGAWH